MPLLHDGAQSCALRTGRYTVGGVGPDALPITSLECCPAVATIVVAPDEPPTIQRITASVVVRVDRVPLGIAAKPLHDGAHIEFGDTCLTLQMDADGDATIVTGSDERDTLDWPIGTTAPATDSASGVPGTRARIVNVRTGQAIELGSTRIVVGRDDSCDFVLRNMRVSRRHFSVVPVQGGYLLRDESANGTLVNESRVSGTYLLGHGDVLRLDEEELRFELDGVAPAAPTSEAEPTALLDLSGIRAEYAAERTRERSSGAHAASLEIVRGHYAGASFAIERPVCAIGRGPQNDVRLRDESVSTSHATLLRKGTAWYVVDLRSANGTFVDGSRVAGERALPSGSRLKLGNVELVFRPLHGAGDPATGATRRRSWLGGLLNVFRRQPTASTEEQA